MSKFALIDIGSRTVKMSIFEIKSDQKKELIDYQASTVNLSEGLYPEKKLQRPAIDRTTYQIAQFVTLANEQQVDAISLVSTGAARIAENCQQLIDSVEKACGLTLRIISGEEEAKILFRGVAHTFPEDTELAVINIGGGSTEIILGSKGNIKFWVSLPLGVTAINEKFFRHDPPTPEEIKETRKEISRIMQSASLPRGDHPLILHTGGEITYMEKTQYPLEKSGFSDEHPYQIDLKNFQKRSLEISQMNAEKLHQFMLDNPYWMEGAIACNTIAETIAQYFQSKLIIPSNHNLNDGLILEIAKKS